MLFLYIRNPDPSASPLEVKGKNAYEVFPKFKETLETYGLKKPRGEFKKHDLDMIIAGEKCKKHLSTFQKQLKELLLEVRRVPHRTFKNQVVLLSVADAPSLQ